MDRSLGECGLNGLDLQNLQLRTSRLQVDTTRPSAAARACLKTSRLLRWRWWLKWLWIEAWTEANFCRVLTSLKPCHCPFPPSKGLM